ncbi:hypothetical protein [Streptomyces sp. NPDC093225]|uniref:hypothetical protein n=1 Tax=Streptomyces sp. NPDC093225 TaxID=3366034 RepID=UPI00381F3488
MAARVGETFPVRCPACGRENTYVPPVFPCACGSPVTPPLDPVAAPVPLTHRNWDDTWVAVRCPSCGREDHWPQPEVGCSCGTVVRLAVRPPGSEGRGAREAAPVAGNAADAGAGASGAGPDTGDGRGAPAGRSTGTGPDPLTAAPAPAGPGSRSPGSPSGTSAPGAPAAGAPAPGTSPSGASAAGGSAAGATSGPTGVPVPRPAFRPLTIRTARDAVSAAALYLRWLGFTDVRQPDARPIPSEVVDLRAPGLVAQVDPTTAPADLRAVECVWLNGLTASAASAYFALAGYTEEARARADELGIPLFVMDLTGSPQPVNDPADALVAKGA